MKLKHPLEIELKLKQLKRDPSKPISIPHLLLKAHQNKKSSQSTALQDYYFLWIAVADDISATTGSNSSKMTDNKIWKYAKAVNQN